MLEWLGVVVVGVATALWLWCIWLFGVYGRGTPLPFAPPREFVERGPYRYSRNPMAFAVIAGAAGLSLAYASPRGLGLTVLGAAILHLYVTHREEPVLAQRFGASYRAYCERVPRWLPGTRPRPVAAE